MNVKYLAPGLPVMGILGALIFLCAASSLQAQVFLTNIPIGENIEDVAVNPVTGKAYVTSSQRLTVIDEATNAATVIPLTQSNGPENRVAVNPVTNKIYVTDVFSSIVMVIDGATNTVTATIPVVPGPFVIAVNPNTNKVYMTSGNSSVAVLDGASNAISILTDPNAQVVFTIAVNTATNKIYVSNENNVTVIDGATNNFTTVQDPNAIGPCSVALNMVTNKIYVTNQGSNNVTVIDGASNTTTTLADPNASVPQLLTVNSATNKVYVDNSLSNNITIIDGATNSLTTISAVFVEGIHVLVEDILADEKSNKIYVTTVNTVDVINGVTNVIAPLPVPDVAGPFRIAVDPMTERVYIVNRISQNLSVIDGSVKARPSCQLVSIASGRLTVFMQDIDSGLASIDVVESLNATVNVPAFSTGVTTPVFVTADKTVAGQTSEVGFVVTDVAGFSTSCDPLDFTIQLQGQTGQHAFRGLSYAEHYVQIVNGNPGVQQISLLVNGTRFAVPALADGQSVSLDIGSAMHSASSGGTRRMPHSATNNIVIVSATGAAGASATILIGDDSVQ